MEFLMSIKSKIAALALAALAVTGGMVSTASKAEARGLGWGIGAGIVGSAIAASNPYPYYGYQRCGWVRLSV
jgi:hypothetical protein